MIHTAKIFRIGSSLAVIIPQEIVKELQIIRGEKLIIKTRNRNIQATRLQDYVKKNEEIGENE